MISQEENTMAKVNISPAQFDTVRFTTDRKTLMGFGRYVLETPLPVNRESVYKMLSGSEKGFKYDVTNSQINNLVTYLQGPNRRFYSGNGFGVTPRTGTALASFSFGAGPGINAILAKRVCEVTRNAGIPLALHLQWEIADLIPKDLLEQTGSTLFRISIDPKHSDGKSGYKIRDTQGLARLGIIPGLDEDTIADEAQILIDNSLANKSFFTGLAKSVEAMKLSASNPISKAISIMRNKVEDGSSTDEDICQLNMSMLMALTQDKYLEFYINSEGVLANIINNSPEKKDVNVFLISQAWHTPRLIKLFLNNKIRLIGGSFVQGFAWGDPQPWVTNPASWTIKEAGLFAIRPDLFPG